jgi:hypothetical protein
MSIKYPKGAAMRADFRAVHKLYHAWLTGLLLMVISRRGEAAAAELVFRIFRRQHLAAFLPGLKKLGLDTLPHAVAAAQYHYLSNHIGGVRVEYMYESDRKAWVRYPPPRWLWHGTAICAIPSAVSAAMLRGWHAHNGVSLGNPRLGFVCTKQTVDGQDGLEGYYLEHGRELAPDERLRFSRGEEAPLFDPGAAPRLPSASWPPERLEKAERNYAMDYIRTAIPELIDLRGPAEACHLAGEAARLIGMQFVDELKRDMAIETTGAMGFAEFFLRLAQAQGDEVTISESGREGLIVRQRGWQLMRGIAPLHPVAFEVWNTLWEGSLAAHDRRLAWTVLVQADRGADAFEWKLGPKRAPVG